ncbi:PREDICTED: putative disease resistance protein RGA3 [Nelumbo nucifera]|uniref:Disease resistance protein RGA3 n=2 Tax=Nelumbo nucifera TaxID=4432 RepID=A0A1U7Z8I4_NELNU|nr:PREDICTED: putative disease resistance protein RGA3 [Nelumbo nucifera]DAD39426.1 TPA_asm: hypothetical protein HUJ06_013749 [Nelumbo nucifera]
MADPFTCKVAEVILTRVIFLATKGINLTNDSREHFNNLKMKLETIQGVLQDAQNRQTMEHRVGNWLKKVQDLAYDAEDMLDEFTILIQQQKTTMTRKDKVRNFFSTISPVAALFKMADRIKSVSESFDNLGKEATIMRLVPTDDETVESRRTTHSMVEESEVFGRDGDKTRIVNLLINPDDGNKAISILPIVGMAGLGKTTLAQVAFNNGAVVAHFDERMWVCISVDFNIERILKQILESLGEMNVLSNLDVMLRSLQSKLMGKKFLLVLDDVWDEYRSNWNTLRGFLLKSQAARGSKIIVTTSKDEVAKIMGTLPTHHLGLLSKEECWLIFSKRAFAEGSAAQETPRLIEIGKKMVDKCRGLPLAAKALGSLMYYKQEEEWVAVQTSEIWDLSEAESGGILPELRLSYDHLPSNIKQCFRYCSVFPKDYEIDRMMLIQQWIAHGFIGFQGSSGQAAAIKEMEDIANDSFNYLLWNSFFQDVKKNEYGDIETVKMHDLVHDLAQHVSKAECLSFVEDDEVNDITITTDVRHLSVYAPKLPKLLNVSVSYEENKLRTCLLWLNFDDLMNVSDLLEGFSVDRLLKFKCLRVLDLVGITQLPASFQKLKLLRYLDLSENQCEKLPESITTLYNLQTLRLKNCRKLKVLPMEMRKLVNLRHLDLFGCINLEKMPMELGKLLCLQTLPMFIVGRDNGHGIEELQNLLNLRGLLAITNLENVNDGRRAKDAKLEDKLYIQRLDLEWCRACDINIHHDVDYNDVLEGLEPHPNLKGLQISNFGGSRYPGWMREIESFLPNLVGIALDGCWRWENLPMLGHLPLLKILELRRMMFRRIQFHGDNSSSDDRGGKQATTKQMFPSLKTLWLTDMPMLVEWMEASTSSSSFFPCLEKLIIKKCAKLRVTPDCLLPSLKRLRIESSNAMLLCEGSFAVELTSLTSLQISNCEKLEVLPEWLLENNKNSLRHLSIMKCPKLEAIPRENLQVLTSLKTLRITDCLSMPNILCLDDLQMLRLEKDNACEEIRLSNVDSSQSVLSIALEPVPEPESETETEPEPEPEVELEPELEFFEACEEF